MENNRKQYQKQYREQYDSKRVNLTLSKEEHQLLSRAAKLQGKKPTTYIKELALTGIENQTAIPKHLEDELRTLRFAVSNIANNVNQMAHYSHMIRSLNTRDEHNLMQHLKQLDNVIQQYTQGRINDTNP